MAKFICVRCGREREYHEGLADHRFEPGMLHEFVVSAEEVDPPSALHGWWIRTFEADFRQMEPKVGEYTSADLVIMGHVMAEWLDVSPVEGQEMACMFYTLGKVARAVAAYREKRLPSEDTLHDIVVYAMMARRIREVGGWPGQ